MKQFNEIKVRLEAIIWPTLFMLLYDMFLYMCHSHSPADILIYSMHILQMSYASVGDCISKLTWFSVFVFCFSGHLMCYDWSSKAICMNQGICGMFSVWHAQITTYRTCTPYVLLFAEEEKHLILWQNVHNVVYILCKQMLSMHNIMWHDYIYIHEMHTLSSHKHTIHLLPCIEKGKNALKMTIPHEALQCVIKVLCIRKKM